MALQFPHSGNPVSGKLQDPSVCHIALWCAHTQYFVLVHEQTHNANVQM